MARFYNSRLGAFCSADPVEGQPGDPQSWNRYAYVRNDPVDLTDPSGRFWGFIFAFLGWIFHGLGAAGGALGHAFGTLGQSFAMMGNETIPIGGTHQIGAFIWSDTFAALPGPSGAL